MSRNHGDVVLLIGLFSEHLLETIANAYAASTQGPYEVLYNLGDTVLLIRLSSEHLPETIANAYAASTQRP